MANKPGRRPKLDDEKQRELCALIMVGCTRAIAARYVGTTAKTVRCTAIRDEQFAKRLRNAEMHQEVSHLQNIMQAGRTQWRASAWALERRFPDRYYRRRPELITREELDDGLQCLAEALVDVVPDNEQRDKMLEDLEKQLKFHRREDRDSGAEPGR